MHSRCAGSNEAALRVLTNGTGPWPFWWYYAEIEPAFAPLRNDAKFTAWVQRQKSRSPLSGAKLRSLRVAGVIPQRGSGAS